MTDIEDRKLARWRATRDGALYACPHCWHGQREAGRCSACRRFEVAAVRGPSPERAGLIVRPSLGVLASRYEDALAGARRPKRRRRGARGSEAF